MIFVIKKIIINNSIQVHQEYGWKSYMLNPNIVIKNMEVNYYKKQYKLQKNVIAKEQMYSIIRPAIGTMCRKVLYINTNNI